MKKEDIIRKLTSRKFWLAVAAFVTELIVVFRGGAELAESVTAIIMAGATVIAYIVGEGLVDAEAKDDGMSPQLALYSCPEDDISPRNGILPPGSMEKSENESAVQSYETGRQMKQKSYAYFIPVVDGVQGNKTENRPLSEGA